MSQAYKISRVQVDIKFDKRVGNNGSGSDSSVDVNGGYNRSNDGKDHYQM